LRRVKGLIDRLLARQSRLASRLATLERADATSGAPESSAADAQAELAALAAVEEHLLAGRVDEARRLLEPFESSATQARTLTLLARISAIEGDSERCLQRLRRAEALDPMDRATWRLLADHLMRLNEFSEELKYRRKLSLLDEDSPAAADVALIRALVRVSGDWKAGAVNEIRTTLRRLEAKPDAVTEHIAEAAECVYGVAALVEEARRAYRTALPCPPTHADTTAQWLSMADWCERCSIPIQRDTASGREGRRPQMAELRDVMVAPALNWTPVVDGGRTILAGFEKTTIPVHRNYAAAPLLMQNASSADLRLPLAADRHPGPALLMGGHTDLLRHMVDYMGALAVAESFGARPDLPVVVHAEIGGLQQEQLAHLGMAGDRLLRLGSDQVMLFDRLVVPSRRSSGMTWVDPELPAWYRRRFAAPTDALSDGRIYISGGGSLHIDNDGDLSAMLQRHGFVSAAADGLTLAAAIGSFSDATHVVAPLGPALAHMVLCRPGASIVALTPAATRPSETQRLKALADACGHTLRLVPCVGRPDTEGPGPLLVPLATVRLALGLT
jgi:capsular polysaccharide biosynthesis protein